MHLAHCEASLRGMRTVGGERQTNVTNEEHRRAGTNGGEKEVKTREQSGKSERERQQECGTTNEA